MSAPRERADARNAADGRAAAQRQRLQPTRSVAAVAAASVDGYLRNASRRMRVPAAEGGRGTRRKLDMVTSAQQQQQQHEQEQAQQGDDNAAAEAQDEQPRKDGDNDRQDDAPPLHPQQRTGDDEEGGDGDDGEDDEWDAVELVGSSGGSGGVALHKREGGDGGGVHASKREGTAKRELTAGAATDADATIADGGRGRDDALPRIKDEAQHGGDAATTAATTPSPSAPPPPAVLVKSERLDGSAATSAQSRDDAANDGLTMMMPGARRPLTEQTRTTDASLREGGAAAAAAWQRTDPAYAAMVEQRDALAAQRRSQRMQRASQQMTQLLVLLVRSRHLWRAAHHPRLVRHVLRLRDDEGDVEEHGAPDAHASTERTVTQRGGGRKRTRSAASPSHATTSSSAAATQRERQHEQQQQQQHGRCAGRYVMLECVQRARVLVAESHAAAQRRLSLAPAWVTPSRDGVGNRTSQAVQLLLTTLNTYFVVAPAAAAAAAAGADDGDDEDSAQAKDTNMDSKDSEQRQQSRTSTSPTTSWSCALQCGALEQLLRACRYRVGRDEARRVRLPHPVYMTLLFVTLASLSGLHARLVTAVAQERSSDAAAADNNSTDNNSNNNDNDNNNDSTTSAAQQRSRGGDAAFLQKMSLFMGRRGRGAGGERGRGSGSSSSSTASARGGRGSSRRRGSQQDDAAHNERTARRLPSSCFWAEVWSAERGCYIAVNACATYATLWGAPYTFAVDGDCAVDVTPRYTSRFSAAFAYNRRLGRVRQYGFLWKNTATWDDNRDVVELLLAPFCRYKMTQQQPSSPQQQPAPRVGSRVVAAALHRYAREQRQLDALMYAETVPTTLQALHHHPLFVIEADLARHEGVYPKDTTTTVGSVKGHMVYKRAAVVSLRSRDGWLREGRGVRAGESPYKTMPPPSSRPFAAPSQFYGVWQTEPFAPLPLQADGSLPRHGRTSWYVLLDKPPPPGIARLTQPQMARVARRMQLDFAHAVTAFVRRRVNERRRGTWEAVLDGIVVKASDAPALTRAYGEWVQLVQEQEATRRRQRALQWWLLLTQRVLAMDRLQSQYMQGAAHGPLPSM